MTIDTVQCARCGHAGPLGMPRKPLKVTLCAACAEAAWDLAVFDPDAADAFNRIMSAPMHAVASHEQLETLVRTLERHRDAAQLSLKGESGSHHASYLQGRIEGFDSAITSVRVMLDPNAASKRTKKVTSLLDPVVSGGRTTALPDGKRPNAQPTLPDAGEKGEQVLRSPRRAEKATEPSDPPRLGKAEVAMLYALASRDPYPDRPTRKAHLSFLTDYSITSSTFSNALGRLRSLGLAAGSTEIHLTERGRAHLAGRLYGKPVRVEPSGGAALVNYWTERLSKAPATMLRILADRGSSGLEREQLADRSGYSLTSSSFANALGQLRSLGLVERGDPICAAGMLR